MSKSIDQQIITIPIPASSRQIAQEFAQEQSVLAKAKQIYLNTLSVLVVNTYLQMLDIPTNLEASYSMNSVGRLCADVADLLLTGVGHLECRSVRINEDNCHIPPEVWDDRIGYVIVQLDIACTEGKILGFLPSIKSSIVNIQQLQPLSELIVYLHQSKIVFLRQWLEGIYQIGWQTVAELSSKNTPVLAFRSKRVKGIELDTPAKIKQVIEQLYKSQKSSLSQPLKIADDSDFCEILAKLLQTTQDEEIRWTLAEILWTVDPDHTMIKARRIMDLGMQFAGYSVALMVAILPKPDKTIAVLLRLYPMGMKPYLPANIQLAGLYANGEPFLEVAARNQDDYIQLKFSAEFGEQFGVRVSWENATITENFVV